MSYRIDMFLCYKRFSEMFERVIAATITSRFQCCETTKPKETLCAGASEEEKKPQHSRHPFLNCWTGDEPASPYGGRLLLP
ncbi:LOW QUALITY PROTEIN: hypothetical protein DAPPUDRAFT_233752 [Daphnia pulex]|uniref:Uncharacterized protein n=1 Tax=Daphnia pulex TaxID=6669 RepID=E9FVM2_DAPPU|nr:LOW QUALITY PROTEIN: hypothetical protein DAPPUDRAFT_233752 [Daphnia pulex]|eukprot:EFX89080.1 LOW QUALITY PROTEIN: hypothetical protein DAPPUDRAFT_233752 [Daphnia pulex]